MIVKICGMRDPDNIKAISALKPNLMGFIFYEKSARFVDFEGIPLALVEVDATVEKVAVFVNEDMKQVERITREYDFDFVQLHGDETPDYCCQLAEGGIRIIKAISVGLEIPFDTLKSYEPYVEYFLFDTRTANRGGSGKHFNWDLLKRYPLSTPFLLSGGISENDIEEIKDLELSYLAGVDANSRLETAPGLKDIDASKELINQVRTV
ncbi:phosphoribosylanthranilate isomerase [Cryomorphaceae bacterium]|nr:phosphoribosylanthranilate isomerase [Cryomorphaceae bacterium]